MNINQEFDSFIFKVNEVLKYPILKIQNIEISIWSVILFFLIITLSKVLAKRISKIILDAYLEKSKIDIGKQDSIIKIINYIIYTIGIIIALQTVGIDLSALLAGGAILALGIGFGIQNLITNFVAGLLILIEQPIKKGDLVEVDDILGTVTEISIRSTTVHTLDNTSIIVPNSKFITENVENWTHGDNLTRIHVAVGVSYSSDVELVEKILIDVANDEPSVLKSPEPKVQFLEFGDSSLNFDLLVWIDKPKDMRFIKSRINFKIIKAFRENKVEIPFPQRDLHLKELPISEISKMLKN